MFKWFWFKSAWVRLDRQWKHVSSELNQATIWICDLHDRILTSFIVPTRLNSNQLCQFRKRFVSYSHSSSLPPLDLSPLLSRPTLNVDLHSNMYFASRPRHCPNRTHHRHHRSLSSRSNHHDVSSTDSTRQCAYVKRHKRSLPDNMAFFAPINKINSQRLAAPTASLRSKKSTTRFLNGDIDLSSDLEISFASNVSLHSPPRHDISLASDCEPMDISPAPPVKPPIVPTFESMKPARPRAFTSGARLFGADISNNGSGQAKGLMPSPSLDQNPPLGSVRSSSKKIQRSALPTEWLAPSVCSQSIPKVCLARFF